MSWPPLMSAPRVMVVEDERAISETLVESLELDGYEVRAAPNGAVALETLAAWPADLIILDLWMPVMNGYSFVPAYRLRTPRPAPIVILSAALYPERSAAALRASAVLGKPFEIASLLAQVRRLVPLPEDRLPETLQHEAADA